MGRIVLIILLISKSVYSTEVYICGYSGEEYCKLISEREEAPEEPPSLEEIISAFSLPDDI